MIDILSLYNQISNSDKKLFESKVDCQEYKKGSFLLLDGDIQNRLYLVKTGLLMMYFDKASKMKVVDFAYSNRFCADIDSFSNQTKSVFCIECMEDSMIESISYENLNSLFDISKDIERAYRVLTEKILGAVIKRHLDLSCLTIEERFAKFVATRPELFKLVQHKYIASYLNTDPTNFSKLYHNFAKKPIKFY